MQDSNSGSADLTGFVKTLVSPTKKTGEIVQIFDSHPADAELARFVDKAGSSYFLNITETLQSIEVKPGTPPIWAIVLFLSLPAACLVWFVVKDGQNQIFTPYKIFAIVFGSVAIVTALAIFYGLSRFMKAKGDYFTFDKINRSLNLNRTEVHFSHDKIYKFVNLYARTGTNRHPAWKSELSLLAKTDDGKIARYPVVIDRDHREIQIISHKLANSLRVPLKIITLDKKTSKALRIDSNINLTQETKH